MASSSKKSAAKANLLGKREPLDDLETKPILRKHKGKSEEKKTTEGFADSLKRVEFLETKSDQPNLITVKETAEGLDETPDFVEETVEGLDEIPDFVEETVEGLDETPDFVEEVAVRKKTLFVGHFSPQTTISDIINYFENVEGVVRVQLVVNQYGEHRGCGFVEFASANEAKEALQNKNGEYLNDCKILLDASFMEAAYFPPKFCLDHKVRPENYLGQESISIGEGVKFPKFVKDGLLTKKTLFVANLSPQTKIPDIVDAFKYNGDILSVRLIVNHEGKHVGCGFVECCTADAATRVLERHDGEYLHDHTIFLARADSFSYTPRPKYTLAELLWYEDCLRREILPVFDERPRGHVEKVVVRNKTLFVGQFSPQTEIPHIINFFKDVGEVVYVRLIVGRQGKHVGYGYVEFASTNEAQKALEKKNGKYLHDHAIFLGVAETDPYNPRPKCCLDHKVWYKDYLQQESLLIEEDEDETMEGLVEEVAERKKTLFVTNLPRRTTIFLITKFFKDVAEVLRVRLIVNHMGEHVGCGFVEFASVNDAKKALQKNNGKMLLYRKISLDVAEIAPYPLRPKYKCAEKIWYQDCLRRESCVITEDDLKIKPYPKKQREKVMGIFCGKKMTFSDDD